MAKALRNSYFAVIWSLVVAFLVQPVFGQAYLENYNPEKGFGRADKSLTTIFLKIAGSLEHHGSPEPYLRFVMKEHDRIEAKRKKAGNGNSSRPEYLTDEYLENLLKNWKKLEGPLQLQQLCRDSGRYMRHAIRGSWHKAPSDWVAEEGKLTKFQARQFAEILEQPYFKKKSKRIEDFYADGGGWDRLSEGSKKEMSNRFWLGKSPPKQREQYFQDRKGGTEIVKIFNEHQNLLTADSKNPGEWKITADTLHAQLRKRLRLAGEMPDLATRAWDEKDSVRYAHLVKWEFERRFSLLDKKVGGEAGDLFKAQMNSMIKNLLVVAHSEILLAINGDG